MLFAILLTTLLFAAVLLPILPVFKKKDLKARKKRLYLNLGVFGAVMVLGLLMPVAALADPVDAAGAAAGGITDSALKAIAAALAVGLSGIGGGIAVGPAASSAIGAMAEDPSTFGKSLIFVALGEGIAIYGLLISFLLLFVY